MSTKNIAVVSRMTGAVRYGSYQYTGASGHATRVAAVVIKGGSGTVDKFGRTSEGEVTYIDEDQLAILRGDQVFRRHEKGQFVGVFEGATENDVRAVQSDLKQDDSRQLNDADFKEDGPKETATAGATPKAGRGRPPRNK